MKNLITLLLIILSLQSFGQSITPHPGSSSTLDIYNGGLVYRRFFHPPMAFTPYATYDSLGMVWIDSALTKKLMWHNGLARLHVASEEWTDSVLATLGGGVSLIQLNDSLLEYFPKRDTNDHGGAVTFDYFNNHASSTDTVTAGTGLTGGKADHLNTISMPNVGTASTYGDDTHFIGITTDAQGRVSAVQTYTVPATGGTVTTVTVNPTNGVTASVSNPTTTPNISIGLGDITPTSVNATGTVAGSNLSGTNTGDQTITLIGDVTGSGTGSFATTIATVNATPGTYTNATVVVNAKGQATSVSSGTAPVTSVAPGTNIAIAGTTVPTVSVTGTIGTSNGGTGTTATTSVNGTPVTYGVNNTLPIGTGTVTNVIAGTNISVTGTSTVQPTINISGTIGTGNGGTGATTTTSVNGTPISYGVNNALAIGTGTVTTVTANALSPIFTASVANPTTTPSISYSLSSAAAYTVLCNTTNASAAPVYSKIDAENMMFGLLPDGNISSATNWNTAYNNRIGSFTVTGSSGAATFTPGGAMNIPTYTAAGLGAVPTTRNVNTTAPITGGGDLSADRTIAFQAIAATSVPANTTGGSATPSGSIPYSTSGTATSSLKESDANANISTNNTLEAGQKIVTAGGTTTFTVGSPAVTHLTGVLGQTLTMPVTSTLALYQSWTIYNESGGSITVNSSGGNLIQTMTAGTSLVISDTATGHTTAADWAVDYGLITATSGTVTSVTGTSNRITSSGGTTPAIDISASYVGQSSITTLGAVTSGTWSTGAVIAGATMTLGSDANYDVYYRNSSGVLTRLAAGTDGNALVTHSTTSAPTWTAVMTNPLTTNGDIIYGVGSTPTRLAIGGANTLLHGGASAPAYSAVATGDIAANAVTLAKMDASTATARKALLSQSSTSPIWSTETWAVPSTSGNVLTSDGTNWVNTISYNSANSASTIVQRDANNNCFSNDFSIDLTSLATAASTTTLTVSSDADYRITGSTPGKIIKLPATNTLTVGKIYTFKNLSSVAVTFQSTDGTAFSPTLAASSTAQFQCNAITNAAGVGEWDYYSGANTTTYTFSTGLTNSSGTVTNDLVNGVDGTNIVTGTTTGIKIGTATTQKVGFFNSTPIVQPTGDVITALQNLGLGASLTLTSFVGTQVVTATGAGTYTPTAGAKSAYIWLVGSGGGGGGVKGATSSAGGGGGGGAGSVLQVRIAALSGTYSYTVGVHGSGGSGTTPSAGGNGGASVLINGGTTYVAPGGTGGSPCTASSSAQIIAGGAGGTVATSGDVNGGGDNGKHGETLSGTLGYGGGGGSCSP